MSDTEPTTVKECWPNAEPTKDDGGINDSFHRGLIESPWKSDLACLEAETSEILQRYGKSRSASRSAKNVGSSTTPTAKSRANIRPWTQSNAINRHRRMTGTADGTNKIVDSRSFTSISKKNVKVIENEDLMDDKCRMFKADGTARNLLRDTISSALSTSEFDSVSSLLASGRPTSTGKPNGHINGKESRSKTSPFLFDASPHMVSVVSLNGSSTKVSTRQGDLLHETTHPTKPCSLSIRNINYTGFDKCTAIDSPTFDNNLQNETKIPKENDRPHLDKEVCFNCWSAGNGKKCSIHKGKPKKTAPLNSQQNLSMCKNWDAGYLRRKYRSEEIEEYFSKRSQSLVFDKSQKQFRTVEEPKHPIYRLLTQHIARLNFTFQRRQNVQTWFRSFISKLKEGLFPGKRSNASAQILRLKSTIRNLMSVRKLSATVIHKHPKAPVTGTTMRERYGQEQVLVDRLINVNGIEQVQALVIAGPTPVPKALYQPRKYEPLPPKRFVLSEIQHCSTDGNVTEDEHDELDFLSILLNSTQFATFGRKRANENLAVGGLSAEMIVSQKFTRCFPPQYKNFTCNYETMIVPPIVSASIHFNFPTLEVPVGKIPYIRRELVTPLDKRLPPTIMTKTGIEPNDRHFFGSNRPEQTGEEGDFGFPTSTWAPMPFFDDKIDTNSFHPSESVATPNLPTFTPMRTMKVDETYPFRKEKSRTNAVDDLFHLLLSNGDCSQNKLQMFTCVGSQQAGYFMQNGDPSLPIGRVAIKVIRSWAFLQDDPVNTGQDKYDTDEKNMVYKEESTPLGLGGVVFSSRPRHFNGMPSGVLASNSTEEVRRAILRRVDLHLETCVDTPSSVVTNDPADVVDDVDSKALVNENIVMSISESKVRTYFLIPFY